MPTLSKLQSGARQPLAPEASPRTGSSNRSGRNSRSQQAPSCNGTPRRVLRAGVRAGSKVGGGDRSTPSAEGSLIPTESCSCR